MTVAMNYFRWAFIVTLAGLILSAWLGWATTGTVAGALGFLTIGAILAALEISLSFDNAIVNANTLNRMSPVWQRRFLTWGILIAVFGMRLVFPLLIVVVAAQLGPIEALRLAALHPAEYAEIIEEAHPSIAAFGGAFLMMVALRYFFDTSKDIHWIGVIEAPCSRLASVPRIEMAVVIAMMAAIAVMLNGPAVSEFLWSSVAGLATFLAVDGLGSILDKRAAAGAIGAQGGLGAFLYLEVLDASFSFDGVIGAFALTQNLFLIAIGLGIGAMYVRSMTIMLVERRTLSQFRYLEHGAFWSILVLSLIMFAQTMVEVPHLLTGFLGISFIGLALLSSIRSHRIDGEA